MSQIDINQTVETSEDDFPEADIIIEDGAFDGFEGKTINITENSGGDSIDTSNSVYITWIHYRKQYN